MHPMEPVTGVVILEVEDGALGASWVAISGLKISDFRLEKKGGYEWVAISVLRI